MLTIDCPLLRGPRPRDDEAADASSPATVRRQRRARAGSGARLGGSRPELESARLERRVAQGTRPARRRCSTAPAPTPMTAMVVDPLGQRR